MSSTTSPTPPVAVVVDTSRSPNARLHPVPIDAVKLEDAFWRPRREQNRKVIIPGQYKLCEDTGRIDNLRIAAGMKQGEFEGFFFNDSDVYKLLEAAAWQLADVKDPELEHMIDDVTTIMAAAQRPDGYLNSYFMGERAKDRFTNFDLHEMYCAGHLFQAAVAYYRTTGKTNLLNVATKLADHLCDRFGPEADSKHFGTDGHPEVEMALVELYRVTGNQRYLEQAQYFVDARGFGRLGNPFGFQKPVYHQDHLPFRQLTRLEGHAVRAVYLNCGANDICAEANDHALHDALEHMWASMTQRQMYLHGGLGPRYENEGFGRDYELPNDHAHAETCASVANVMWNWRMLLIEADARFTDLIELTLYNSVLSGISLDGMTYFYQNPLSSDGDHHRQTWFRVACCPSNISRTIASLPGYVYTVSENAIWVHLYVANTASIKLPDGQTVRLQQQTDYPWSGDIRLRVLDAYHGTLYLRLPSWCEADWLVTINGQPIKPEITDGHYLLIDREWQADDAITLTLPMPVRRVECNPMVAENVGRVALMRGPLLYCVEAVDHGGADVRNLSVVDEAGFTVTHQPELLGGVTVLQAPAQIAAAKVPWGESLYRSRSASTPTTEPQSITMTAIPYFAWANREAGTMQVWLDTHSG